MCMDSLETTQVHMDSFETHFGRNLDTPWGVCVDSFETQFGRNLSTPWGGVHGFLLIPPKVGYGFPRNHVWAEFSHTLGGPNSILGACNDCPMIGRQ